MKLRNRIMSWILSPGAYALWHSLGNPEEWEYYKNRDHLRHKPTGVELDYVNIDNAIDVPGFIAWPTLFFVGSFVIDCEDALGWFDTQVIAGRVYRTANKLRRAAKKTDAENFLSKRQRRNRNLFTKLTVNQVAE